MTRTLDVTAVEPFLLAHGLKFRRRGNKAECESCPFCGGGDSGDKRTFVVYLDSEGGNYKCLRGSCGATGSFWQLAEHLGDDPKRYYAPDARQTNGFRQTVKQVQPKSFTPPPKVFHQEPFSLKPFTDEAYEYLIRRGFTDEVLDSSPVGCDEDGNIAFAYYHEGQPCLVKLRKPHKPADGERKAWAKWKDSRRVLWCRESLQASFPLVITMGEFDALALRQSGVANVVSIPSGDEDFAWVDLCWDDISKFKTVIVWPDKDVSGEKCLHGIADRLGKERIKVVRCGFKDANEMLLLRSREIGAESTELEILKHVHDAQWLHTSDLIEVVDIPEHTQDFTGYQTGFEFLDKAFHGFLRGQLSVHVGNSKHGKSSALTQITATSIQQGAVVCVWSGEDDDSAYKHRMEVHLAGYVGSDILTSRAGRDYAAVKPEFRPLIADFLRSKLFLYNKRVGIDESVLVENFTLAHKRYGCDVFVVDNLMKIVSGRDTTQQFFRQAQIINTLSDFAKDTGVHVHIAAHINKQGNSMEPPTKDDVSGSKDITNLADLVLAWWRVPDSVKTQYSGCESLCAVLANRPFGDEASHALRYDWRIKRFGQTTEDLHKSYFL